MNELVEVLEWIDHSDKELVHRITQKGFVNMKMGTQVNVQEEQVAVFFRDGKSYDMLLPGKYILDTQNLILISKALGLPFGFNGFFRADVYFVNCKTFENIKWETKNPVVCKNHEFSNMQLKAFGMFAVKIKHISRFLDKIVGPLNFYRSEEVKEYLNSFIVTRLTDILNEKVKTIFELPKYYDELSSAIKIRLKVDFDEYGLDLIDFIVGSITPPSEVKKIVDEQFNMFTERNPAGFNTIRVVDEELKHGQAFANEPVNEIGLNVTKETVEEMSKNMFVQPIDNKSKREGNIESCRSLKNSSVNDIFHKFCPNCGIKLLKTIKCIQCGEEILAASKFCCNCGVKVIKTVPTHCVECNMPISADVKYCAQCGIKTEIK